MTIVDTPTLPKYLEHALARCAISPDPVFDEQDAALRHAIQQYADAAAEPYRVRVAAVLDYLDEVSSSEEDPGTEAVMATVIRLLGGN